MQTSSPTLGTNTQMSLTLQSSFSRKTTSTRNYFPPQNEEAPVVEKDVSHVNFFNRNVLEERELMKNLWIEPKVLRGLKDTIFKFIQVNTREQDECINHFVLSLGVIYALPISDLCLKQKNQRQIQNIQTILTEMHNSSHELAIQTVLFNAFLSIFTKNLGSILEKQSERKFIHTHPDTHISSDILFKFFQSYITGAYNELESLLQINQLFELQDFKAQIALLVGTAIYGAGSTLSILVGGSSFKSLDKIGKSALISTVVGVLLCWFGTLATVMVPKYLENRKHTRELGKVIIQLAEQNEHVYLSLESPAHEDIPV